MNLLNFCPPSKLISCRPLKHLLNQQTYHWKIINRFLEIWSICGIIILHRYWYVIRIFNKQLSLGLLEFYCWKIFSYSTCRMLSYYFPFTDIYSDIITTFNFYVQSFFFDFVLTFYVSYTISIIRGYL